MKNNRQKFHESKGLPENANLDIVQLASISGYPEDALRQVYRRATAPKEGSKEDPFKEQPKKKRVVKKKPVEGFTIGPAGKGVGYNRVYAFIMGKYGKDLDIATTFGLVSELAEASPAPKKKKVVLSSLCLDSFPASDHSTPNESDNDSSSL
jgi:hypothetical protein